MAKQDGDVMGRLLQEVFAKPDGARRLLEHLLDAAMQAEVGLHLGAAPHQRSVARRGYRNGHKPRRMKTRVGEFPSRSSCDRLLGAQLIEVHEQWAVERYGYFNMENVSLAEVSARIRAVA